MVRKVSLAHYIYTRLRQLGVGSVHGVPGDYTLRALDLLKPAGLRWIGSCNELNSGYAADGYARIKGISALYTTYGVGELSALNAVAGSYAERSPVVHIVGGPSREAYEKRAMVHHSLGDGNLGVYAEIYKRFTVAQASLMKPEDAPRSVDHALQQCVRQSRPVYIELPSDMVEVQVPEERLQTPLDTTFSDDPMNLKDTALKSVLKRIYEAKQPYILVDGLTRPIGITEEVNELARITGFPTFALTFGGGVVDGTLSNYHGVHAGPYGTLDFTPYTDTADLALLFGPLLSDTNTQGWTARPKEDITIAFQHSSINIGQQVLDVKSKPLLKDLLHQLKQSRIPTINPLSASLPKMRDLANSLPPRDPSAPLDQDTFYIRMSSFFRPHDAIIVANGTPLVGSRDFVLPPKAKLINSAIWVSVGHMLPLTQGIALAQRELGTRGRTIFFEGDGGFQATGQELSTIIRYKLDAYIFLINNDGYTFERLIHGMDAEYNDLQPWRYLMAPEMFGAPTNGSYEVETHDVGTWGELQRVLASEKFQNGKGLKMVNVRMSRGDVNQKFKPALKLAGQQLMGQSAK